MIDYGLDGSSQPDGWGSHRSSFSGALVLSHAGNFLLLVLITLINLRGIRDRHGNGCASLSVLFTYLGMLAIGIWRAIVEVTWLNGSGSRTHSASDGVLILRAFASGSTARSGVEAISNGIPASSRQKRRTPAER
jgi:hypothetical protein